MGQADWLRPIFAHRLEAQFECELQRSRCADLIEAAEASVGAAAAEAGGKGLRRDAKGG